MSVWRTDRDIGVSGNQPRFDAFLPGGLFVSVLRQCSGQSVSDRTAEDYHGGCVKSAKSDSRCAQNAEGLPFEGRHFIFRNH